MIEREGLVAKSREDGLYLLERLRSLLALDSVGDVRGLGLLAAVELVADKGKREFFDPALKVGERIYEKLKQRGVLTRFRGDAIFYAPPLVISEAEVDRLVSVTRDAVKSVLAV